MDDDLGNIKNTSEDESFSEETHVFEIIASKEGYPVSDDYDIPGHYNIDTLIIMPVNMTTSFIYWEITEGLVKKKASSLNIKPEHYIIRVFERENMKEVSSFTAEGRIGKKYIHCDVSFKPLYAEMGVFKGDEFITFLLSKTISSPSFRLLKTSDEICINRVGDRIDTIIVPESEIASIRSVYSIAEEMDLTMEKRKEYTE